MPRYRYRATYRGKTILTTFTPEQVRIIRDMGRRGVPREVIATQSGVGSASLDYVAELNHDEQD